MDFLHEQAKKLANLAAGPDGSDVYPENLHKRRRRGIWLAVVLGLVGALLGIFFAVWGYMGWQQGEITLHWRGQRPYLAALSGPNAWDFYVYTWLAMVLGSVFALGSFTGLVWQPLRRRADRDSILFVLGSRSRPKLEPDLPRWFVIGVFVVITAVLVLVFFRAR